MNDSIYNYLGCITIYSAKSKTYTVKFLFKVNDHECEIQFHLCENAINELIPMVDKMLKKDLRCLPIFYRMYRCLQESDYWNEKDL